MRLVAAEVLLGRPLPGLALEAIVKFQIIRVRKKRRALRCVCRVEWRASRVGRSMAAEEQTRTDRHAQGTESRLKQEVCERRAHDRT